MSAPDPAAVEALALSLYHRTDLNLAWADALDIDCHDVARAILASDWLADLLTAVRAEERRAVAEEIAQAIEERQTFAHGKNAASEAHVLGFGTMRRLAARIAREAGTR